MKDLLRNTLDGHSKKTQTAQPQRSCHYDNDLQSYDYLHPAKAPRWTYVTRQNMIYDTEIKEKTGEDNNNSDDYEEVEVVSSKNAENVASQNTN